MTVVNLPGVVEIDPATVVLMHVVADRWTVYAKVGEEWMALRGNRSRMFFTDAVASETAAKIRRARRINVTHWVRSDQIYDTLNDEPTRKAGS